MLLQDLVDWHRRRIQILLDSGVDLLAIDTIPALKEVEALVQLLGEFPGAQAWLSVSCKVRLVGRESGDYLRDCKKLLSSDT